MDKVSFVVTSYNYEQFIEETLNSIKNQSFQDFEIIVVDDFSTDNSVKRINTFINNNPNLEVKLIIHDKNQGQLKASLTGLSVATGDFVCFVDSDDVLETDYTKKLLEAHLKTDVGFVSCNCTEIDEFGNIKSNKEQSHKIKKLNLLTSPFGGWYWSPMSSAMFRKSSLEVVKDYNNTDDWRICPDKFLFNFVHLTNCSAILGENLVKKRIHSNNAGKFNRTKLNFENNKKIRKCSLDFIKKHNCKNKLKCTIIIYLSYFYIPIQVLKYVKKSILSKFQYN